MAKLRHSLMYDNRAKGVLAIDTLSSRLSSVLLTRVPRYLCPALGVHTRDRDHGWPARHLLVSSRVLRVCRECARRRWVGSTAGASSPPLQEAFLAHRLPPRTCAHRGCHHRCFGGKVGMCLGAHDVRHARDADRGAPFWSLGLQVPFASALSGKYPVPILEWPAHCA